ELISNVLDNAIKYTPQGGQVTLRCGKKIADHRDMRAYVEVEDDGPGVAVGEYTRLTQRFYRVPGVMAEGTGLGLAIAQEIAHGHGADLRFGQGAYDQGMKVQLIFNE
ncbi:MAG: sensor histidine kinase, partial [Comamonas sp.]